MYHVFQTANAIYKVMAYAAEGTLASNIPAGGYDETKARHITYGITLGLSFMHNRNIVHR